MLSTVTYRPAPTLPAAADNARRRTASGISARQQLLSGSLHSVFVQKLEPAIRRILSEADAISTCRVALFEIEADDYLHCNVTHRYVTESVAGWSGPGHVADGFVYNRRFRDPRLTGVLRHIRHMVDAARV